MAEYKQRLRTGWTTGACAAAAAKAACLGLLTGVIPKYISIVLPRGNEHTFLIKRGIMIASTVEVAIATVVKDAGDDPDVTHGVEITVALTPCSSGKELTFQAGEGVGTVTNLGLPLKVGEPAINPGPRSIIRRNIASVSASCVSFFVNISVVSGMLLAQYTLNTRLGVLGGLSILGTTGVVVPYSCSAWITSLYQEVKAAYIAKLDHITGITGYTSEVATQHLHELHETTLIKTANFIGTLLQSIRRYPIMQLILFGGLSKLTKVSQGVLNLHSRYYQIDLFHLAHLAKEYGAPSSLTVILATSGSMGLACAIAKAEGINIPDFVAKRIVNVTTFIVGPAVRISIILSSQNGTILAIEENRH